MSARIRSYADAGVRRVDHRAVAEAILGGSDRDRRTRRFGGRWLVPALVGLLLIALAGAGLVVGSRLLQDQREARMVEAPVRTMAVEAVATTAPDQAESLVGAGPCAPMVQRAMTWGDEDWARPIPDAADGGPITNGDILVALDGQSASALLGRLDPSPPSGPVLVGSSEGLSLPYAPGFEIAAQARIVASPDGRAVAVEDGDLGVTGCGDPVVLLAEGGTRRPFPVGAYQLVTDLAWAPDGGALYGVRRPTVDARSRPYVDDGSEAMGRGAGVVLRWDAATGETIELGSPCTDCPLGQLFVAPDGARVAVNTGSPDALETGEVAVLDPDGAWRIVAPGRHLLGWTDRDAVVTYDTFDEIRVVTLDGTERMARLDPCCHGTGYGDSTLLSPDGTRLAGITLSRDFGSRHVTVVDLRDGSASDVWGYPTGGAGRPAPDRTPVPAGAFSGEGSVVAWAPDSTAVLVLERSDARPDARLWIVRLDGSGASASVRLPLAEPPISDGYASDGGAVAWLAERS